MKKSSGKVLTFIICLAIVYGVAAIGGLFTSGSVNSDWYNSIKPAVTPPGWVFPIVWNILFFLIGVSLYLAWISAKNKKIRKRVALIFAVNLALNLIWSVFYFGMHNPLLAFLDIILLIVSIVWMIIVSYGVSKISAWLLAPYLIWVCLASILNWLSI